MKIDAKRIGEDAPVRVIAEVAQAHDGSLGMAHAYIDAVADAGADGIKFQTHIAAEESTLSEPWRVRFSPQDETRYAYWHRMAFSEPQWQALRTHARKRDLMFLSSPFSVAAVDLLQRIGVTGWKVGAGEITTPDLLERMLDTGLPVLLSNGMSTWAEMDRAVTKAKERDVPVAVFQCTSAYPCPPEKTGLNVLAELRSRYRCPVGLSDHSGTIYAGLAACALGADLLEVHVTFSRQSFGPDVPASVTLDELRRLVQGARFIRTARSSPVDKDAMAESLAELRATFRKRVVLRADRAAGHRLTREDLLFKKAGSGIDAERHAEVVGRKLRHALPADAAIGEADLD